MKSKNETVACQGWIYPQNSKWTIQPRISRCDLVLKETKTYSTLLHFVTSSFWKAAYYYFCKLSIYYQIICTVVKIVKKYE